MSRFGYEPTSMNAALVRSLEGWSGLSADRLANLAHEQNRSNIELVPVVMFNPRHLSTLLTRNVNSHMYPRMFVMSPNGTLLAYSTPANIKELRDQAAIVSMVWKQHDKRRQSGTTPDALQPVMPRSNTPPPALEALTMLTENGNIIVRALQPKMLFVLVGGAPPGCKQPFQAVPEYVGDTRFPADDAQMTDGANSSVHGASGTQRSSSGSDEARDEDAQHVTPTSSQTSSQPAGELTKDQKHKRVGALHCQRKKLDSMAEAIVKKFGLRNFEMPDDSIFS